MAIDKQCFTKIVKNDLMNVLWYIVLPIVVLCTSCYIGLNIDLTYIAKLISENLLCVSIITLDLGFILAGVFVFWSDGRTSHTTLFEMLSAFMVACGGLCGSSICIFINPIAIISNVLALIIIMCIVHGYVRCKKVDVKND